MQVTYDPPSYATNTFSEEYRGQMVERIEWSPIPGWMRIRFLDLYSIIIHDRVQSAVPEFHLRDGI